MKSAKIKEVDLFYPKALKDDWFNKDLPYQWKRQYPMLFDKNDIELVRGGPTNKGQPNLHFVEWFVAIYYFHTRGYYSLVEKYYEKKPKQKIQVLKELSEYHKVNLHEYFNKKRKRWTQPPDLLIYKQDRKKIMFFVEVKDKDTNDKLHDKQKEYFLRLSKKLGVPVIVANLHPV